MTLVTPFCDPRHIQRPKPDIASLALCPIWPGIEAVNSAAQFEKTEHSAPDGTSRCRVLSFWRRIRPKFALTASESWLASGSASRRSILDLNQARRSSAIGNVRHFPAARRLTRSGVNPPVT